MSPAYLELTLRRHRKVKAREQEKTKMESRRSASPGETIGVCPKTDACACMYTHPGDVKGKGKPGGGKCEKGGKRSASNSSRAGKAGGAGGKGSPRSKAVTDVALLCKNYLKGKCDKGKACKFHHNGPCHFHAKGNCKRGDDCVFSHHISPPAAAAAVSDSEAPANKSRKKKDTDDA